MVQYLWSSIVARQQATETVTAAAKHTVLCSRSTTTFRHVCPERFKTSGQKALHSCSVRHEGIVRC